MYIQNSTESSYCHQVSLMNCKTHRMACERRDSSIGTELGRFLHAHRIHVTPKAVGLTVSDGLRRTPGLRREELATLAGISSDYYARLERGKETNPSPQVVDALARTLLLSPAEHEHLRVLVTHAARQPASHPPATPRSPARPGIKLLLEGLRPFPAYVLSPTMDIIACNPSGLRLLAGLEDWPAKKRNFVRYVFLHPAACNLFDRREEQFRTCVSGLRAVAGFEPGTPELNRLVEELTSKSPEFAELWPRYEVSSRPSGNKTFHHPEVGDLTLSYEAMQMVTMPGHCFLAFYAEPGTPDHDKLVLLDQATDDPSGTRC
ncbi:helix-turn-helix transcriptional regulator [Streptomyces acidicola]|uniref:helix-turn-helix transcriptional regulator n=1 Tax=Streptomyces acidicola TaxID=2596892 RepID=UPI00380AD10B